MGKGERERSHEEEARSVCEEKRIGDMKARPTNEPPNPLRKKHG